MRKLTRGIRALALATVVLCITASQTSARMRQDKGGVLRVALVDIERISNEYTFNINAAQALQKQALLNDKILRTLVQHALLPAADHTTLANLVTAENSATNGLTPAQKDQMQKLLDKSKGLTEEYNALQQKVVGQLNMQDKQKLTEYAKTQGAVEQRLTELQGQMKQALQNQADKDRKTALKNVREAIAKVAKQKGITLVLSNEVAWYAEDDLTDDALKVLNNAPKVQDKK